MPPLAYASTLAGHTADVRALASYRTEDRVTLLLSGSRDQTARLWVRHDKEWTCHVIDGGNGFVNAVALFPDIDGKLYALTGGQDALVNAYLVTLRGTDVKISTKPHFSLVGHAENVCALSVYKDEYIVSGSWDTTVRVWKNWQCVATFADHNAAVWSVLPVDSQRILSASADKNVCMWSLESPHVAVATYTGATQPVRGLARVSDTTFAACGNDGAVRVYPLDTNAADVAPEATLRGHASFVYALSGLPDGLASSGEDHSVCVWKEGALRQVLTLPAISVWCLAALPNGDLACGTSDGAVTVFSAEAAYAASAEATETWEAAVASQVYAPSEFDASVPRGESEMLAERGTDGATILVRDGSTTKVYRWSGAADAWKPVGVVTETAGASQKKMLDGVAYDYVFDVDAEEGAPPLKLAYNANENPYHAANRFIAKHELPATYLDQVVSFLEKNTQSVGLAEPRGVDPYTGASSYTPGPSQEVHAPTGDPFTGGGGLTSSLPPLALLPQTQYLAFAQANLGAARAKISALAGDDAPLREAEARELDALVEALEQGKTADAGVLGTLLSSWPPAKRFPLLDLLRVAAGRPGTLPLTTIASHALVGAEWDALANYQGDRKTGETNAMLALRALSNGFLAPNGPETMHDMALEAVATLQQPPWGMLTKNARIALATVAYNYSVLVTKTPSFAHTGMLLSLITELLRNEGESEMMYRSMVALGNVLCSPSGASLPAAARADALHTAEACAARLPEERIQTIWRDVAQLR